MTLLKYDILCASPVLEPALPKNYSICDFKILKKIKKCQKLPEEFL
jgi:hypothetical protein